MPNSVRDGVRPSAASMRAYSSAVRLCCLRSSGEMLAGAGTAESVLVVMAMSILSHDQTGLKDASNGAFRCWERIALKNKWNQQRQKGRVPFETSPLSSPFFFEDLDRHPDHNVLSRDAREIRAQPWFPSLSRRNVRRTSYLTAIREFRCRF